METKQCIVDWLQSGHNTVCIIGPPCKTTSLAWEIGQELCCQVYDERLPTSDAHNRRTIYTCNSQPK